MIHIDIAQKFFGKHLIIDQLNLALKKDEFVCLIGPSGCGKSSLLSMIAGLDSDYSGRIDFEAAARIGYVFQNPRLLPWRTVRENIDLVQPQAGNSDWIDHLLEVMGLSAFQGQHPQKLSLGMSRRVALVRAFSIKPDLLLMDEPFVSLDAPTARTVRSLMLKVWTERPHTVIFVTHDLREALSLADRLIFLSSGPMRSLAEIALDLPREQREEDWQTQFSQQLLEQYPSIRPLL